MLMQHRSPVAPKSVGFYSTEPCLSGEPPADVKFTGKIQTHMHYDFVFTGHFRCCNGFPTTRSKN